MRFLSSTIITVAALTVATSASAETASTTLVVAATFNSRTSLSVSADVLQFDVVSSDDAVAMVDFSARARTAGSAQVVLSVEPLQEVSGPHGPALNAVQGPSATQSSLTFSGVGEGTLSGAVAPSGVTVAGRWTGSGLRHGTLVFVLRGTAPGKYSIPVRFVLSAP